jgi:hypothetical protein
MLNCKRQSQCDFHCLRLDSSQLAIGMHKFIHASLPSRDKLDKQMILLQQSLERYFKSKQAFVVGNFAAVIKVIVCVFKKQA